MKKLMFILFIAFMVIVTVGCVHKNTQKNFNIKLKGNPTTGYQWTCRVVDDSVISLTEENYNTDDTKKGMTGAGGEYVFSFDGVSSGETDIIFEYLRSWEGNPIETKIYHVVFDGAKITVNEK